MLKPMRLSAIATGIAPLVNAELSGEDVLCRRICCDSRDVGVGDLFVAINDGHKHIASAMKAGAVAVIVDRDADLESLPGLKVDNSVKALGGIAALNRQQFTGDVAALTGSAGKTTTKDMITATLEQRGPVCATRGNFNNEIGMPQTLLNLSAEHWAAVIEMGARQSGDIAYLANIARPNVAVVTNVAQAHLETFGTVENIARGKGEIYAALGAADTAVVNVDSQWSAMWLDNCKAARVLRLHRLAPGAAVGNEPDALYAEVIDAGQCEFRLSYRAASETIRLAVQGTHNISNALTAAGVCLGLGLDLAQIKAGLQSYTGSANRLQTLAALHGATLIDDSYNANPASVRAATDVLAAKPGARFLVLGDLGELGDEGEALHAQLGRYAFAAGLNGLLSCGPLSRKASEEFGEGGQHFANKAALIDFCRALLTADTTLLVKGSRSAAMEEVVQALAVTSSQDSQGQVH